VNAVLLVPILIVMIKVGSDPEVMGEHRNGRVGQALALGAAALVGVSLVGLAAAAFL
jgi:Mn2+/Fe2+ NRAMP family transporter